jgi:Asp-tRNA(Asn)/Glu-tRNA(Gln) amidotransferase A subunit family amidase
VFIHEVAHDQAREAAPAVMKRHERGETMRLYGVPFAIKDNIDISGCGGWRAYLKARIESR